MKSIRSKIVLNMTLVVVISLVAVASASLISSYMSTQKLLQQTLTETVDIAASRIESEFETYKSVAYDAGSIARLAKADTSMDEKEKIMAQRAASHGFVDYDILNEKGVSLYDGDNYSDREYFEHAMNGESDISVSSLNNTDEKTSVIVSAPLWEGGIPDTKVVGVICFKPVETFLSDVAASINISENASAFILDSDGATIGHTNAESANKRFNAIETAKTTPDMAAFASICQSMVDGKTGYERYSYSGEMEVIAYTPIPGTEGWSIAVNAPLLDYMNSAFQSILLAFFILVAAIVIAVLLSIRLAVSISKPVHLCCDRIELLAAGDISSPVPQINTKDETGKLAKSTATVVNTLSGIIGDISWGLSEIADGNFNVRSKVSDMYIGDFAQILTAMKNITAGLSDTLDQVRLASGQVSSGSEQVSAGAQALSQGATEQASAVQELAATINEISEQVQSNANNAKTANELAVSAGNNAAHSNEQMNEMISAMNDISDKSGQIGKIIKTIEDIAFQTNILALNAAVEAARAGAAGKGFAVVADEVRNLASKSSDASKSTSSLIESSISAVANGTKIAAETAQTMTETVTGVQQVTDTISHISAASDSQAASIVQITQGIDQISSVVQTNSATSEQSAAASEELSSQAQLLNDLVSQFNLLEHNDNSQAE